MKKEEIVVSRLRREKSFRVWRKNKKGFKELKKVENATPPLGLGSLSFFGEQEKQKSMSYLRLLFLCCAPTKCYGNECRSWSELRQGVREKDWG